jgi:hypothetical protein
MLSFVTASSVSVLTVVGMRTDRSRPTSCTPKQRLDTTLPMTRKVAHG